MPLTRLPSRPRNSSRPPQPFSRSPNPSPSPAPAPTFPASNGPTRPTHGATKSVSLELGQDWEPNDLEEKLGIHEIWTDIDYWEQALTEKGTLISGKTMSVHSPHPPLRSPQIRPISAPANPTISSSSPPLLVRITFYTASQHVYRSHARGTYRKNSIDMTRIRQHS